MIGVLNDLLIILKMVSTNKCLQHEKPLGHSNYTEIIIQIWGSNNFSLDDMKL